MSVTEFPRPKLLACFCARIQHKRRQAACATIYYWMSVGIVTCEIAKIDQGTPANNELSLLLAGPILPLALLVRRRFPYPVSNLGHFRGQQWCDQLGVVMAGRLFPVNLAKLDTEGVDNIIH